MGLCGRGERPLRAGGVVGWGPGRTDQLCSLAPTLTPHPYTPPLGPTSSVGCAATATPSFSHAASVGGSERPLAPCTLNATWGGSSQGMCVGGGGVVVVVGEGLEERVETCTCGH